MAFTVRSPPRCDGRSRGYPRAGFAGARWNARWMPSC